MKNLQSGSFNNITEISEKILELLGSDLDDDLKSSFSKSYILKGKGDVWLFDLYRNTYLPFRRGVEIFPIDGDEDENFMTCSIGFDTVLVPKDDIYTVGWN